MIFDFVEESHEPSLGSSSGYLTDDEITLLDPEEKRLFWESQQQLLTEYLFRTSRIESKIRQATKDIVEEIKSRPRVSCRCGCASDGCRRCLQREISERLQRAGYNCGICKAKWMKIKQIPPGEHSYIEVLDISDPKKGVIRVIIELNFRTEFEMAKGSQEYNHLVSRLPEIYVGKAKRLESLIKILCSASKRCMRDQKMHIAPWRKLTYMQAKWQGLRESESVLLSIVDCSNRLSRPMVSLLTFDLVESF